MSVYVICYISPSFRPAFGGLKAPSRLGREKLIPLQRCVLKRRLLQVRAQLAPCHVWGATGHAVMLQLAEVAGKLRMTIIVRVPRPKLPRAGIADVGGSA